MQKIYAYTIWLLVTLFVTYSFCLNTAAAVFFNPIKQSLHASNLQVSLASASFIFGYALMQIPAGIMLDRFRARYVVGGSLLLLTIGTFIISFATNLGIYALANLIQGLGASFSFVAAAVLISQWFPNKQFPIFFGLTQTISCLSAAIIHYYLVIALTTYPWNIIYKLLAIFGFTLFILTLLIIRNPRGLPKKNEAALSNTLILVFTNSQLWLCYLGAATSFGVLLAYASLWYMQIQNYYSVSELQAVVIGGLVFVGIGIGTPVWGWISNKYHTRVTIIFITVVLGNMALLLGLYLPHFQINSLLIIKAISFLIGLLLSGSMLFYTIVNEIAPSTAKGTAISVLNTWVFLFNTLLLFLPYLFITQQSHDFFTYLWILPFSIMLSLLLIYFIKNICQSNGGHES